MEFRRVLFRSLRENASWAGEVEDKSFTGLHRLNGAPLNGAPHVEIHAEVVGDHVTGIDRDCLAWLQVDDVDRAVDGQHYFTFDPCPHADASLTDPKRLCAGQRWFRRFDP